jgi:hypothetical protein
MNLHLDAPLIKADLDDRRPALEAVLLRVFKKVAETLEYSLLERPQNIALPVLSRADRSFWIGY